MVFGSRIRRRRRFLGQGVAYRLSPDLSPVCASQASLEQRLAVDGGRSSRDAGAESITHGRGHRRCMARFESQPRSGRALRRDRREGNFTLVLSATLASRHSAHVVARLLRDRRRGRTGA